MHVHLWAHVKRGQMSGLYLSQHKASKLYGRLWKMCECNAPSLGWRWGRNYSNLNCLNTTLLLCYKYFLHLHFNN